MNKPRIILRKKKNLPWKPQFSLQEEEKKMSVHLTAAIWQMLLLLQARSRRKQSRPESKAKMEQ